MAISKERLDFIRLKVNTLRKYKQITQCPVMAGDIIRKHFYGKCLIRSMDLSDTVDAVSEYDPVHKICVIVINEKKDKPYLHKRLNFSLAHELGHYILEHHQYYKDFNTAEQIRELEDEADEFAGLLLVPESRLRERRLVKSSELSGYFFVSQEVIRIRKDRMPVQWRDILHKRYY